MISAGTGEQFQTVRSLLDDSGFTEPEVCLQAGIGDFLEFEGVADHYESPQRDALSTLIRLFVDGRYVHLNAAEQFLGASALEAMVGLGLIETKPDDPNLITSPVALYPTQDVYIVSDRWNAPDRGLFPVPKDVVYPAIVANSQRFLRLLPRRRVESFLDLCCGTGVAALQAAKNFAAKAYAFDVAERSTLFAEFNRRLNALENVAIATGDLYEPARGAAFDQIAAHPPYVPALRPSWTYLDGGEDGESVMRRIVAELPDHLHPGGLLYMLATGSDRSDAPFEQRVRHWLGERQDEFDVALVPIQLSDPDDFATRTAVKSKTPEEDLASFKKLFADLRIERMVYGAILIQKKAEDRSAFTVRRQKGPETGPDELLWLLQWESLAASPYAVASVLSARLRPNPDAALHIRHKLLDSTWEAQEHTVRTEYPFSMEAKTDAWVPYLMAVCDGSRTVAEHFNDLKQQNVLPASSEPAEFAAALKILISGGFLLVEP